MRAVPPIPPVGWSSRGAVEHDERVEDDAEALRRRLYAPGASAADLGRFEAAAVRQDEDADPAVPPEDREPEVPRRRRLVAAVACGLVAVAAVVVVGLVLRAAQPVGTPPDLVATSAADRAAFVDDLREGADAGIAAWLLTHRGLPRLRDATRYTTVEDRGTGAFDLRLRPPGLVAGSGRATVLLVVDAGTDVGWTVSAGGRALLRRGGAEDAGALTATTFGYRSGRTPDALAVDVPAGVRWGAAVVYTD